MPRDSGSLSRRLLKTPAALRTIAVLVNAAVLLAGCATPVNFSSVLRNPRNDQGEASTVRSQSDSLRSDPGSSGTAQSGAADYGQQPSGFGASQPGTPGRFESSFTASGHSFLKPKARLGRPIPVPDSNVTPMNAEAERGSPDVFAGGTQVEVTVPDDSRNLFARTPWSSNNGHVWQPDNGNVPSWKQMDESFSDTETAAPLDSFPPLSAERETLKQTADSSVVVGATESIAENSVSVEINAESAISEQSAASKAEFIPAPEPTMLDRFRGLYAPRLEDNSDKLRKQVRRWPDPFRLLKDRDENADSVPAATAPQPTENEAPAVAVIPAGNSAPSPDSTVESPLDTAIAELETTLADWPGTPSGKPERPEEWRQRQTDLRLLSMVAGRSAESIRVIESLPAEEQEFWQSLMLAMNRYREIRGDVSQAEQLSQVLDHLRDASRKLQPLSILQIRHMTFCDRIYGFGNVSAFPTADFNPGQRILVYTDVQNFRSELTPEGNYRSDFAAVIEFMRQGDDEFVEMIRLPQILDHCNVERTDYFQSFELTLPALAGTYTVRVRLKDKLSLQTAESELKFNIRSQNSGL